MRGRLAQDVMDAYFEANPTAYTRSVEEVAWAEVQGPDRGVATPEDYADGNLARFGDIYTLTFVRGLSEDEVLRRFGVTAIQLITDDDVDKSLREIVDALGIVTVTTRGNWVVAFEQYGWTGTGLVGELSRDGGEAVAVLRHDYASPSFDYAQDGQIVTSLEPRFFHRRYGTDPDRLNDHLRVLGIDPDADEMVYNGIPAALALASRITGVRITEDQFDLPLPGGHLTT